MKKSIIVLGLLMTSILASAQKSNLAAEPDSMSVILNSKMALCEKVFPLNSYIQLAAGNESEVEKNTVLKSQIKLFSKTGELVSRAGLTKTTLNCVNFAEGLLAGSLTRHITTELAAGIARGLEKAAESIK